jgi:hypothetical protein
MSAYINETTLHIAGLFLIASVLGFVVNAFVVSQKSWKNMVFLLAVVNVSYLGVLVVLWSIYGFWNLLLGSAMISIPMLTIAFVWWKINPETYVEFCFKISGLSHSSKH